MLSNFMLFFSIQKSGIDLFQFCLQVNKTEKKL
jgi:hypothetical protein